MNIKFGTLKKIYTYKELKTTSDDEIKRTCTGIIFDSDDSLDINEIHRYLEIIEKNNMDIIECKTYDQALIIKNIKDNDDDLDELNIRLADDYEIRDRSYIDSTIFKKSGIKLAVPLNYVTWNIKFDDEIDVYSGGDLRNFHDKDILYVKKINKEDLKEINRICQMVADFPEKLTDIEKIIIICNYIERYCQFIEGAQSHLGKDIYQLDDKIVLEQIKNDALDNPATALLNNFGVCRTFAQAITLLLNNPYIKVNAHMLKGGAHVWNSVELDGITYQLDITRCITRSKNRDNNNLKTLKFDMSYILFGTDFSDNVCHENVEGYYPKELSKESFNQDYLRASFEHLEETGLIKFDYSDEKIPYSQRKI